MSGITVTGRRLNLYGSITAPTPTPDPAIRVTSPDGGEVWLRNTVHSITWTSEGTVGNVNLHYSTNGGTSWTSIASNQANNGTYSWTTPNVISNQTNCRVRVQETDGSPSDQSDGVFSIVLTGGAETVSVPDTPNGPATGSVGTYQAYVTGGSASSLSDPVQYYFDWGDGNNSGWLAVGTSAASHSWTAAGTYSVRARARCATHTAIVSAYSPGFSVTEYNEPTWVGITRFDACVDESEPTVEWRTASEMGPAGFNLWRLDRMSGQFDLVNANFLPTLTNSPQGGIYRLADPGVQYGEPVTYRLEEIDALGRVRSYGPFTITFGASWDGPAGLEAPVGGEEPSGIYGFQRFPRGQSEYEKERLHERQAGRPKAASLAAASAKARARITVKDRGLFYISAAQVAAGLGITKGGEAALIGGYGLKLTGLGKEIAWLADANGAGIFFYNEGVETVYCDRNVYYLEKARGRAMETASGGSAGAGDPEQSFRDTLHFEGNQYSLLLPSMDPEGDLWFWDYVVAGGGAKPFLIEVPGVASGKATLKTSLQGATDTAAENDHHAIIALNGKQIGETVWDGTQAHEIDVEFDASLLQDGANTLTVSGALDMGAPYSTFYVESFDLTYPRLYKAVGNMLICRGDGNSTITVSGFMEPQALALDVSNPLRPRQLTGIAPDVSGRVTFVPRSADAVYLVSGLNAALRPESVVGDQPANLRGPANQAEYIVIAPEEFKETAKQLARYRQRRKLKSVVVTLEEIYDVFNHGVPSPYAIRDFLAHAYSKWGGKKLRYAVLAGKGTYDYNDYQGHDDNLVPVILGKTPEGLCASDRMFGDVKGRDGLPEIAIGRLPAVSNRELEVMIGKIKDYESGQGAWTDRALFIADNDDSGGDFVLGSNELAGMALGLKAEMLYLAGSAAEIHDRIIASWNAGAALVSYCGHAGVNQLAAENIFNISDAISMANGGQLPLATMFTCAAGRFEIPGFTCLAETLLLNGSGGAVAGLFPTGAAMNTDSLRLGGEFYKAAYRGKAESAGAALLTAMKKYLQLGGNASLFNVYNWLGDPALAFK